MKGCLRIVWALFGLICLLLASGCGKSTDIDSAPGAQEKGVLSASAGQVAVTPAGSLLTPYAAARVADQVSFGATPALTAELSKKGLEAWISDQYALPVSLITAPEWVINFDENDRVAFEKASSHL